jgi:hypothetical protein
LAEIYLCRACSGHEILRIWERPGRPQRVRLPLQFVGVALLQVSPHRSRSPLAAQLTPALPSPQLTIHRPAPLGAGAEAGGGCQRGPRPRSAGGAAGGRADAAAAGRLQPHAVLSDDAGDPGSAARAAGSLPAATATGGGVPAPVRRASGAASVAPCTMPCCFGLGFTYATSVLVTKY